MADDLLALVAVAGSHCAVVVSQQRGLLASLFVTGLVGGVTHCAGMCGPFVLTQVAARLEGVPASAMSEWHRLSGAALLPYHLGRLTTYSALGAVVAGLAGSLGGSGGLRWLSAVLLTVAAVLLVGYALPSLKLRLPQGVWWSRHVGTLAKPLFTAPLGWRGYALGVLLGFIPCGLLYGALVAAAATHDPLAGGIGMAVFVLGTVPALVGIGLAGHLAGARFRTWVSRGAPILLMLNAAILVWMAGTQLFTP